MIALLDINILIALAWPSHAHHDAAHAWFHQNHQRGWATCPTTQVGFIRVSTTPAAVKTIVSGHEAFQILEKSLQSPHHHFWPQSKSIAEMNPILKGRVMGPKQLGDLFLLNVALENGGVLATIDHRIAGSLPANSPLRDTIEVLPV